MKTTRIAGPCALLAGLVGGAAAYGQATLLQRLQETLTDGAHAIAKPVPAVPSGGTPYVGLVVDDSGERGQGVRVISVRAGGPAQKAGVLPGDLITAVGENPVRTMEQMASVLQKIRPGDRLVFQLERNSKPVAATVTVAQRTDEGAPPPPPPAEPVPPPPPRAEPVTPPPPAADPNAPSTKINPRATPEVVGGRLPAVTPSLGITVGAVIEEAMLRNGLPVRWGALVASVRPDSPCAKAGLPAGAAIVALDDRRIESPEALVAAVRQGRVGQEVELSYYVGADLRRSKVKLIETTALPPAEPLPPPLTAANPFADPKVPVTSPIRNRVEGLLDRFVRPTDKPAPAAAPAADQQTIEALRGEVQRLQQQLIEAQKRLKTLEEKLEQRE